MKSKKIKSSCLLLGMSLLLTACGQDTPDTPEPDSTGTPSAAETALSTAPPSDTPAPVQPYDDRLIQNMLDDAGSFVDELDQSWEYSYQVPQLLSDSRDARMINRELEEVLVGSAEEAHRNMDQGTPPTFGRIDWESHWNGSLLSLIVSRSYSFHSEVEYWVYNFDFETEKSFTGPQLLDRLGVSQDAFFQGLRRAVAAEHDRENVFLYEQYGDCYDAALDLRAQSISARDLNWTQVKPFLSDSGTLTAIINRAVYAGGGVMREMIEPQPEAGPGVSKTVQCEFVSAELKENQVTITFHKTRESEWAMPAEGVEYEVPYHLEGLYGTYTDIAMAIVGQNLLPHIFLLDDQGRVTFCDVMNCAFSGPRFFAAGPLMGVEQAVSFEAVSSVDGQGMVVHTADGRSLDLADGIFTAEAALHNLLKPDCIWYTGDGVSSLGITEGFPTAALSWTGGEGEPYSGRITYGGMTESGLQYPFFLWTEGGERIGGVLTLECQTNYTAPEGDNKLILTQYTGPQLSASMENGAVSLYRHW